MATILTIEDNVETQLILKRSLEMDHSILVSYDLSSAREYLANNQVDLILLDLMLPDGSGRSLIQGTSYQRENLNVPTIVLSSLDDLKTRIECLKSGADDYIIKPFEKDELLARIESVLRRGPTRTSDQRLSIADLIIDFSQQVAVVSKDGQLLDLGLTPIELKILTLLAKEYDTEMTRDEIQSKIWGHTYISERNVDTHICKLRKKLRPTRLDILNKRDKGYYLEAIKSPVDVTNKPEVHYLPMYGTYHLS